MSDLKIFDSHLSWQKSSFGNADAVSPLSRTHRPRPNSAPSSQQRKSASLNGSRLRPWTRSSPIGVGERLSLPKSRGAKDPQSTETAAPSHVITPRIAAGRCHSM